jgi:hypothetical protein
MRFHGVEDFTRIWARLNLHELYGRKPVNRESFSPVLTGTALVPLLYFRIRGSLSTLYVNNYG